MNFFQLYGWEYKCICFRDAKSLDYNLFFFSEWCYELLMILYFIVTCIRWAKGTRTILSIWWKPLHRLFPSSKASPNLKIQVKVYRCVEKWAQHGMPSTWLTFCPSPTTRTGQGAPHRSSIHTKEPYPATTTSSKRRKIIKMLQKSDIHKLILWYPLWKPTPNQRKK